MGGAEWPLTCRDDELRQVVDAVARVGGAVLAGPAGVGKTRLAREAVVAAARPNGGSRWAVASAAAQAVPLGAFATFTGQALTGAADASLLARAATVLRDGAAVVGVDDAHLLDPVSAALVHQLAAQREVRLVVTVRTGELAPDAVTALWKDGLLDLVEIVPLNRVQTRAVLEAGLSGPVDKTSNERLYEVTHGNVLWLRQLVDGERAAGRLLHTRGVWHWSGDPQLSPALSALIEARIGLLAPRGQEVLELLALGEPLDLDVLAGLVDRPSVEDVAQRGLAAVAEAERGWTVRLAHPLFGEAVRAGLSLPRARRLRGLLAMAMDAAGSARPADMLRHAVLLADSDLPADPDVLLAGAGQAASVVDVALAYRLVESAHAAGGGFEAQILKAFLLYFGQRAEEAEIEFAAAAQLAATDQDRIRVALARSLNLCGILDRQREGVDVLDATASNLRDAAKVVELDAGRSCLAVMGNDVPGALGHVRRVLSAPRVSATAISYAGWAAAILAGVQGWTAADDAALRRTYSACQSSAQTAPMQLNIGYWEAFGLALAGYPAVARANLTRFDGVAPYIRFMVDIFDTPIELAAGRIKTAARICRDSALYNPGTRGGWSELLHATACQAYAMAGDRVRAAEAWGIAQQHRQRHIRLLDPFLMLAPAWLAAAEGAVSQAVELAGTAAEAAAKSRQWAIEVAARHTAVCFGDTTQATRLAELASRVTGPRAAAAASHAAALSGENAAGLLAAADSLEGAGLLLLAADASAQAAVVNRRRGAPGGSIAAAARAGELAERCEGAQTPALLAALTPLPITAREREVATLAHAGLSNKQIAARLQVSVRTVEGHVYRACAKLGVADRSTLAELVGTLS